MAKKDIFKGLLNPESKPNRSAFDLSHRVVTSCKAGQLIPVLCEDTVPNDYFEIHLQDMVRTMPLNTAAFLRAKVNYEFYFVPYVQLWHSFPDFVFQREDPVSSYRRGSLYQPQMQYSLLRSIVYSAPFDPSAGATLSYNQTDMLRLLESLGYGDFSQDIPAGSSINPAFSPFRLAAYQKIWNDFYRNPWRDIPQDINVLGLKPVNLYNFDDLACDSFGNSLVHNDDARLSQMLTVRYRGYKKDLLMGSLPEQQFGPISQVSFSSNTDYDTWSTFGSTATIPPSVNVRTGADGRHLVAEHGTGAYIAHKHLVDSSFDVLALKQAEMMQLWRERTLRAGFRNQSQQKAHFGIGSRYYADEHPDFLGSFMTQIGIDEVISQSSSTYDVDMQSGNGALGQIAGKGIGVGADGVIKFHSDTYGIIMCLMSVVPDFEYGALLDKNVIRSTPFDYYTPEFENLGLAPITASLAGASVDAAADYNKVVGFAPRYYEYKTRLDKCLTAFKNGGSLAAWVSERADLEQQMSLSGDLDTNLFYIDPANLDTIFAAQVANDLSYDSDQFIMNLQFFVNAVRPMSVLGLPQW